MARVTHTLGQETFAAQIADRRDEILQALRERGVYTIHEGPLKFTITLPAEPTDTSPR